MYDRILFPTDGSETASEVFEYSIQIASTHDATIHVLNVADSTETSTTRIQGEIVDVLEQEGEEIVEELATKATERGVPVVPEVRQGKPAETIVDYASEYEIDCIVMPTHGRSGIERYLLGSVTERVVRATTVPVLTVTPSENGEFAYPPQDMLLPTDGSQCATLALDESTSLATATGSALHLLTVVETANLGIDVRSTIARDRYEERANVILAAGRKRAEDATVGEVATSVAFGQPYREIRSYITDNDVDLVVIGTHGETNFSRYVLGGVSAKLLRTSPVPVLLVPKTAGEGDSDE